MHAHRALIFAGLTLAVVHATAQWEIQDAHTTASLRGIHYVGNGVAWASGTDGTVLRTEDMGLVWQLCTIPPGAEKLDFRGIQAFDNNTAIVMSSGKGDLSRLYKTTDGCQTWKLVFTNPDKDGFWDAYRLASGKGHLGFLLGDPVAGHFPIWTVDRDESAFQIKPSRHKPAANHDEAAFAASNSSLFVASVFFDYWIATGGKGGGRVLKRINHDFDSFGFDTFPSVTVPVGNKTESSGIFSLDFRPNLTSKSYEDMYLQGVAVGGDYSKPESDTRIAAATQDGGRTWMASTNQPHGYRSSVAFDSNSKTWITVGPNGTDASFDDGRNWRPLKPSPGDAPDADQHWNALSLPFVVGPKGRIGLLHEDGLAQSKAH